MFDARSLIGELMQGVLSRSSRGRVEHALGDRGLGQPGGAGADMFRGGSSGTSGGGMLEGLLGAAQSMLGGAGGSRSQSGGSLGALAGALLGGGGGSSSGATTSGSALGGGAMAVLGGLAMQALQGLGSSSAAANASNDASSAMPLGLRASRSVEEENELQTEAVVILKAMINAAKADGEIDQEEAARIYGKLKEAGADGDGLAFIQQEMRGPMDLQGLLGNVHGPQLAVQVYAASLLAIEVDTVAEERYLQQLATGLDLDPIVVQRIHAALGLA